MRRKKARFEILEGVEIGPAGAEGHCIARVNGQVIFVPFAAPGDIADLLVTGKKKKFLEARIIRLHQKSPLRTDPFCAHFGRCGGCKWQHLAYDEQLKFKQQQAIDSLERLGGLSGFEVLPIIGSEHTVGYRNKLEMTFSDRGWVEIFDPENPPPAALGFHVPGRFDRVMDIDNCHLMPEPINRITNGLKKYCLNAGIPFFNLRDQTGIMRTVMLRCNRRGEWMVLVCFSKHDSEVVQGVMNFLETEYPFISSLLYVINNKRNDTLAGLDVKVWSGNAFLEEHLHDLKFQIKPQSFFQTNTTQAEILYQITSDFAALNSSERVYDLYTGTGSIALYIARNAKEVIGIEYVQEAIDDARLNMKTNGIENCQFFSGDMKDILTTEFAAQHGHPDVVITDPPRDGMHPAVVQRLLEIEPERIVYVSCNPATQARDGAILAEKYSLVKIQPVDMFPHTHHVENIGLWVRKN